MLRILANSSKKTPQQRTVNFDISMHIKLTLMDFNLKPHLSYAVML